MIVRPIRDVDIDDVHAMIVELANFERAESEVIATPAHLREALLSSQTFANCVVIEDAGQLEGFALWFLHYSTWLGRPGIYLEDLYVRPRARSRGYGRELMKSLAKTCVDNNYPRLEWSVLDWNERATSFYESLDARAQAEWIRFRLSGDALTRFADSPLES